MSLYEETRRAVDAATHLTDKDAGAVKAVLLLARKIDVWDVIVRWAVEDMEDTDGRRPMVPANDNVSLASYLKYCNDLGLTPAGRDALGLTEEAPRERSKLAELRSLNGGKKAAGK